MDLLLSVTVPEVTAANYQIICLKKMMMFQLYLIRWGSSFQMHQSLLNRNCSNKVPPSQSASLSHSLRPTVSIENITIGNKMAPFKNIISSYVPCSEHYFAAQQPNSGPVVYMRWSSSMASHLGWLSLLLHRIFVMLSRCPAGRLTKVLVIWTEILARGQPSAPSHINRMKETWHNQPT